MTQQQRRGRVTTLQRKDQPGGSHLHVSSYGTLRPMTDASCFYCLTDPNHEPALVPAVTLWKGTALCAECASTTAANEGVW
jgi:hypothetical protein